MCKKTNSLISFVLATVVCLALCTVAQAQLTEPVSFWRFEEGSGVTTADIGTGGHTGTLIGDVVFVEDEERGSVLKFGTGDGYVETNAWITELGTADFSVAAWIKTREQGMPIIGKSNGDRTWNFHEKQFYIGAGTEQGTPTAGAVHFYGNQAAEMWGLNPVDDGMWHHVCATWDNDTDEKHIYVDGVLDDGDPIWDYYGGRGDNADDWVRIGFDCSGNAVSDFIGLMDDVAIFDVTLTPEQVVELMHLTLPPTASNPNPYDGMTDLPRQDLVLSWKPGVYANKHDVYFGTVFDDVNDADRSDPRGVLAIEGQSTTTYEPLGLLDFGQTYYWRVDEVNAPPDSTIFKGEVWSFTAELFAYPIAGERITVTASSQAEDQVMENTVNGSGLDNDRHSNEINAMWLSASAGPQPTWIQYEFDKAYKLHEVWVWNYNGIMEPMLGVGFKDVTIEYSVNGTDYTTLGTTHEFAQGTGAADYEHNTTVDFGGTTAKFVRLTVNSSWVVFLPQYGLSEVRFLYIPVQATEPSPDSGATNVDVDITLGFKAGREAAKHDVYLSTDEQAVIDETASPVFNVPGGSSYTSYSAGELDLGQTYYWKVNEVNEAETPTTWQGDVLNFSTQEYLVVEDFEDYNDFEPDRIFDTWIDGWTDTTKGGSQVGYDEAPFAEQAIVHGGKQSMPLNYDNTTASYSEATANIANLKVGNDWTKYGIKALSLWFYGDPNNVAQQLYVRLNNTKVVYEGNVINNIARPAWQLWPIDLATVSGLQNVTSLTIGVEGASTAGLLYIDDIRLHPETFASISVDVSTPGDIVIGVPNDDDWPTDEAPEYVIDDASSTKYLHFKGPTGTTGFQVTPSVGAKVVTGLSFTTANDHAERDPIAYELSGSNAGIDGPYTVIAAGDIVDFSQATEWPRFTANETQIKFDNTLAYAHYQLIFTAVRDASAANSMQIAEVEFLTTIPTP